MWRRRKRRESGAMAATSEDGGSQLQQQQAPKHHDHEQEQDDRIDVDSLMIRADAMVTALVMGKYGIQKESLRKLRLMSKLDDEHRLAIADAGAIPHVLELMPSTDSDVQEDAITCLLNLSIAQLNKARIMSTKGALDKIIQTLRTGNTAESRQNAAATILSIAIVESYRDIIGQRPLLLPGLLDLLLDGSIASARDAIKSLFQLSLCFTNKSRIVNAGTIPLVLSFFQDHCNHSKEHQQVANDALALLTQLCACAEGVSAMCNDKGINMLVELIMEEPSSLVKPMTPPSDSGKTTSSSSSWASRSQEHAVAALLNLCQTGGEPVVSRLLEFDNCVSALCSLLSAGSQRAKSKAGALLQIVMVNERS